jgi:hypothetical protein
MRYSSPSGSDTPALAAGISVEVLKIAAALRVDACDLVGELERRSSDRSEPPPDGLGRTLHDADMVRERPILQRRSCSVGARLPHRN